MALDTHAFSPSAFEDAFDIGLDLLLVTMPLIWIVDVFTTTPFTAIGGTGPYTYELIGTPPACVFISSAGLLYGTVYVVSEWTFTVRVTDSTGTYADEVVVLWGRH